MNEVSTPVRSTCVTLGAQGIITDRSGRVLLIRHGYRPGWHFPGGGVERRETVQAALRREVEEETGIIIEGTPQLFGIYTHFDAFPGDHIVLYLVSRWRQPSIPAPNHEVIAQGFFAVETLPEGTTAPTRQRIAEVFQGRRRSLSW